ncbi:glycosyltransferase family 4 protein [Alicyclobacillus dauci]|uniref:Glycosyltransferase family 4 protein n=1 Tax=Alicyclobacillus dauci TaxID=1475485 RepID=A0ABY6Z2T2_9BACL|nr:glycosyltransferase family 4 protein [Alicyclobacillus dauci]WAH36828.1 glycosyltransferase family 4 protein [Alicyclobacillus dauci]
MTIRLCHIAEATGGGVGRHLLDLAKNLTEKGYNQTFLVSPTRNPKIVDELRLIGVEVIAVNMEHDLSPAKDFLTCLRLSNLIRTGRFDIVHCHSTKAGLLGRIACKLVRQNNVVYTPHSFSFQMRSIRLKIWLYKLMERALSSVTKRIICVSTGEIAAAMGAGLPGDKIALIHNGIPVEVQANHPHSAEDRRIIRPFVFGFLGRLTVQKDPLTLIRAFSLARIRDCRLLIMGDGELREECEGLVRALGMSDCIEFTGEISNPGERLLEVNALVLPSLWEGFPYALLESMSLGIPAIVTNVAGNNELIIDGFTGYKFPVGDAKQLSTLMVQLTRGPGLVRQLGKNAQSLVLHKFNIQKMIDDMDNLYRRMIG